MRTGAVAVRRMVAVGARERRGLEPCVDAGADDDCLPESDQRSGAQRGNIGFHGSHLSAIALLGK